MTSSDPATTGYLLAQTHRGGARRLLPAASRLLVDATVDRIAVLEGPSDGRGIAIAAFDGDPASLSVESHADDSLVWLPHFRGAAPAPAGRAGYLLVQGGFTDLEKRNAYNAALPPIYAASGGRYLALAPASGLRTIVGTWPSDIAVVLATFADLPAVHDFWRSPAYEAAKQLRAGGGSFFVRATEGAG